MGMADTFSEVAGSRSSRRYRRVKMPNPGVADGNRCYRPPMVELGTHSVTERAEVGNSPPTGLCILGAPRLLDRMIPALQPTTLALSGLEVTPTMLGLETEAARQSNCRQGGSPSTASLARRSILKKMDRPFRPGPGRFPETPDRGLGVNLRLFPAPLRQGFGGQAPGWRLGALMILPPSSGPVGRAHPAQLVHCPISSRC